MSRGARPGERRGGRKTGVPNKATIEREIEARKDAKRSASEGPMPKDVMLNVMRVLMGEAARYQPTGKDGGPNPRHNHKLYLENLKAAGDMAGKVAPYCHARLAQTTLQTKDVGGPKRIEIEFVKAVRMEAAGA